MSAVVTAISKQVLNSLLRNQEWESISSTQGYVVTIDRTINCMLKVVLDAFARLSRWRLSLSHIFQFPLNKFKTQRCMKSVSIGINQCFLNNSVDHFSVWVLTHTWFGLLCPWIHLIRFPIILVLAGMDVFDRRYLIVGIWSNFRGSFWDFKLGECWNSTKCYKNFLRLWSNWTSKCCEIWQNRLLSTNFRSRQPKRCNSAAFYNAISDRCPISSKNWFSRAI